jgi:uncharacterized protein (TIGR01777 family)
MGRVVELAISGSHGFIGEAVVAALKNRGHRPIRLVRSSRTRGEDSIHWDPAAGTIDAASLEGIDGAVHLAGKNLGRPWWTKTHLAQVLDTRVRPTHLLSETLAQLTRAPSVLVSASAIGYYGDRGDEILTETSGPGAGHLPEICRQWEASTEPAVEAGIRVAIIRTSIVLGGTGGAIAPLLIPFRLGLGGRIGTGAQYWPWISIDDEANAIVHLLETEVSGPFNLAAPEAVRNAQFTSTLGKVLRRPVLLPVLEFEIKMILGPDMAKEMLLLSQRVSCAKLLGTGFNFQHPELEGALRHVLGKQV